MGFVLGSDVYGCVDNGRVVFLDLAENRYFTVGDLAQGAFLKYCCGHSLTQVEQVSLEPLMKRYGLETSTAIIKGREVAHPVKSLIDDNGARIKPVRMLSAVRCRIQTRRDLKLRSALNVVGELKRTKAVRMHRPAKPNGPSVLDVSASFLASNRLISAQDKCLERSIALTHYLMRVGIYPDLVIGVRMGPFAAHAWVQCGDVVLNDRVDEVLRYTPIMVV